jgi:hypothetical protein
VWQPCELVSFLAYLEPVKIKLNKHYIYSNFIYFNQILTVFSKFKKISTVANDNLEKIKTIYWIHKLAFDRGDSSLEDLCCICFQPDIIGQM